MKALLYCTKGKPLFLTYGDCDNGDYATYFEEYVCDNRYYDYGYEDKVIEPKDFLNGKIVAECDYEVEDIYYNLQSNKFTTRTLLHHNLMKLSCLNHIYCEDYLLRSPYDYTHKEESIGKAIHIKNLKVFDEPKELKDYYKRLSSKEYYNKINELGYRPKEWLNVPVIMSKYVSVQRILEPLKKTPQNMMYICEYAKSNSIEDFYKVNILIPVHPELLCKVLNGECTIIVKKKVLKEMVK